MTKRHPHLIGSVVIPDLTRAITGHHGSLDTAFTWDFTPQGSRYWHNIAGGETYPTVADISFMIVLLAEAEARRTDIADREAAAVEQAARDEAFRVAAAKAEQARLDAASAATCTFLDATNLDRQRIAVAGILIRGGFYKLAGKCLAAHKEAFIREVFDPVVKVGNSGMNNYKFALNCLNRGECMAKYKSYARLIKLTDETVEALS